MIKEAMNEKRTCLSESGKINKAENNSTIKTNLMISNEKKEHAFQNLAD